jgi:hypothetical protein
MSPLSKFVDMISRDFYNFKYTYFFIIYLSVSVYVYVILHICEEHLEHASNTTQLGFTRFLDISLTIT